MMLIKQKKGLQKKNIAKKAKGNSLKSSETLKTLLYFHNTNSESNSSFEIAIILKTMYQRSNIWK